MRGQRVLHLAQLDAEPVELDLRVLAAKELELAAWPQPAQVAGAEECLACARVAHELRRAAHRVLIVAVRDADAADVDHARHPRLAVLVLLVEHVHGLVAKRPAVRDRPPPLRRPRLAHLVQVGPNRRLGRAAHAHHAQFGALRQRVDPRRQRERHPVAAQPHQPQARRQPLARVLGVRTVFHTVTPCKATSRSQAAGSGGDTTSDGGITTDAPADSSPNTSYTDKSNESDDSASTRSARRAACSARPGGGSTRPWARPSSPTCRSGTQADATPQPRSLDRTRRPPAPELLRRRHCRPRLPPLLHPPPAAHTPPAKPPTAASLHPPPPRTRRSASGVARCAGAAAVSHSPVGTRHRPAAHLARPPPAPTPYPPPPPPLAGPRRPPPAPPARSAQAAPTPPATLAQARRSSAPPCPSPRRRTPAPPPRRPRRIA
eukprot:scaffold22717_cov71-Phaeocystis_antarctica.AAC.3